jgi:hypothetical protein
MVPGTKPNAATGAGASPLGTGEAPRAIAVIGADKINSQKTPKGVLRQN